MEAPAGWGNCPYIAPDDEISAKTVQGAEELATQQPGFEPDRTPLVDPGRSSPGFSSEHDRATQSYRRFRVEQTFIRTASQSRSLNGRKASESNRPGWSFPEWALGFSEEKGELTHLTHLTHLTPDLIVFQFDTSSVFRWFLNQGDHFQL